MSTITSEIEPQRPSLPEYLAIGRRRRRAILLASGTGLVITVLLAMLWPPAYVSKGTILIEQQEIPQDLVRSTVSSYADERVQVISKRVMTTETLLDIIRRYNLYSRERAHETREALLKRMRDDIGLKMISADVIDPRSGRPTEATIAFEVSYRSRSAELAAKVANELTTLYLNENLTNRTELARQATEFLRSEGDRIDKQIADLETKLEQFKQKNYSKLPEVTPLNMQLLDRTEQELLNAEEKETSLEQQRVFLEAQLAQLKPNSAMFSDTGERILSSRDRLKMLRSELADARAKYAPDYPDVVTLQREVEGLEREVGDAPSITNDLRRELEDANAKLAEARKRYAPDHPDRVRLEREVASLQAQLVASQPTDATKGSASTVVAGTSGNAGPAMDPNIAADPNIAPADADNPAYIQIKAQLSATLNDLKSQADEIAKLRSQADSYQRDVSLAPAVEKEYRDLTRDYDNARLKYQEIRSKQVEARAAQDLEADRQGERFTLIDPPLVPEQPASPNRKLILAAGLILSAGLAAGVVWLLERLDTTIRTRLELLRLVGVSPLALVPHIGTERERRATRRRRQFAAAGAVASVCIALLLIHLLYEPLDVLWFAWTRRLGL
jgi:polysaccharide biosynthesis transport protein